MRAALASIVAFGHVWALIIEDYRATDSLVVNFLYFASGFGHSAVILFFVLSGYWITRSVVERSRKLWSWRSYLVDRLSRLLLVIVPALVLGGVLDGIAYELLESPTHKGMTGTYVLNRDIHASHTVEAFIGNLFFLQDILVHPFGSNGPLWSVAFEFWYYIWFPSAWLLLRSRRLSLGLATFALAWFAPALAFGFLSWMCGSLLYFVSVRIASPEARARGIARWAVFPAAMIFGATLLWARTGDYGAEDPLLAAAFSLFLLALMLRAPRQVPVVAPVARFGAGASFSLYATHFPVMAFATALLIGKDRLPPDALAICLALAVLVGSLVVAWLFAGMTEARTHAVREWIRRRWIAEADARAG